MDFILGLMIGGVAGIIIMCFIKMGGDDDD